MYTLTSDTATLITRALIATAHIHNTRRITLQHDVPRQFSDRGRAVPVTTTCHHARNQVPEFLERTRADVLAVTVGNVHGKYANPNPKLDLPRLERIRDASSRSSQGALDPQAGRGASEKQGTLLALHGASGLPSGQVRRSIELGVCKFNVNTEVRTAAVDFWQGGAQGVEVRGSDILGLLDGSVDVMRSVIEAKMRQFDP